MQNRLKFVAALGVAWTLALPAQAQDADTVVATVNGTDITVGHMIVARNSLPEQYQQLPDAVLFQGILDQLVQQTVLKDSFDGTLPARVTKSIENETRSLIAGEKVEQILAEDIPVEDIQALYDSTYSSDAPETEYNASHILVETKEEADTIKADLEGGADFASTAREKSTGPSGPNGGSLGWFGKGAMVPSFEAAVVELESGAISDPVETQFGWHVIQLNETRTKDAPKFEDVREELLAEVRRTKLENVIAEMEKAADVDRSGADGIDPTILKDLELLNP
ncbi:Foldase protein PrsA [Ascidiaceihabitans donghaensis]|uniref:Parvulin-like PPIase n=1 Tax=Ascidiaceihabitans donghaensis TaxID=1510460 RepID=A0A2R8B8S7_9RHOB|nr:peptidylprolyl isomerase [Ascidiaceihabitans donghaensis]SPH19456.1 Foldase protein PrsA [Ascidiaceihabitans donghaensis]